ncbi:malate:quinone oxidoreductase, partial [Staphylococcus epidermidis]|uniref:malate:quinone oxidoreductase n=1 Tax=Staphylococcus epidermidis TaxID=1282 RepID=UPI0016424A51
RKGDVINEDEVKVYGKEGAGRGGMSVGDLDRGYMDGERRLLFGGFGNIGGKLLRKGCKLELLK